MSFLEAALGSGATPLVAVDGPVAEIKRHIRKVCAIAQQDESWASDAFPYAYSLGFGIRPLLNKKPDHPEYFPPQKFEGQEGLYGLLEWLNETLESAVVSKMNDKPTIWLFLFDLGMLKDDVVLTSMLAHLTDLEGPALKTHTSIILCGPGVIHDLPGELREQCVKLRCPRPNVDEIKGLYVELFKNAQSNLPAPEKLDRLARESAGLTASEVTNLGARSIYEYDTVKDEEVRHEVRDMLADLPGVTLLDTEGFSIDNIGGYDAVKHSMISLIGAYKNKPLVAPKGLLLCGPPGTGKSAISRAVGNEVGWKVLMVSPSEFKDKYVGETGKNMSKLISIAEAIAPCIIVLDEVDGAFGSSDGAKESDSSGDMLSIFLTWQAQPREKPVFVVATCNRLDKLPPEFGRAGRFDKRFFMDVPGEAAKSLIWQHYMKKYQHSDQELPHDENWTGAEIESCCQIAYIEDLSLKEAGQQIVPVVTQMGDNFLGALREYASKSCLDSETGQRIISASVMKPKGAVKPPPPLPPDAASDGGKTIKKKKGKK